MDFGGIDPRVIWIAVAVAAVIIVAMLIARGARKSRSAALRDKFGPEYDHTVRETGNRKRAENALLARAEEVKQFDIRPLQASDRERFVRDWAKVERHFLERPAMAVTEADELVADLMRIMGYPMGDFERHAAHLSVTHPRVVEHYRAGHRVIGGATPVNVSTEDMRQAMLHYRALFEELIGVRSDDVVQDVPRENEVVTSHTTAPTRDVTPPLEERPGRDIDR